MRAALAALCALVVLGGCGDSKGENASSSRPTTTTTAGGGATTSTVAGVGSGPGGGTGGNGSGTAQPGATVGPAAPGSPTTTAPPLTLGVTLKNACVRPGTSQTIIISAPPQSAVGYDAVYSDGKSGLQPGHYGGNNGGHTDNGGKWGDTWVVAANAPAGPVRVDSVGASSDGRVGQRQDYFKVSDATGRCA
jgi:hypothetical protein